MMDITNRAVERSFLSGIGYLIRHTVCSTLEGSVVGIAASSSVGALRVQPAKIPVMRIVRL
jgi:hypothetical protein